MIIIIIIIMITATACSPRGLSRRAAPSERSAGGAKLVLEPSLPCQRPRERTEPTNLKALNPKTQKLLAQFALVVGHTLPPSRLSIEQAGTCRGI